MTLVLLKRIKVDDSQQTARPQCTKLRLVSLVVPLERETARYKYERVASHLHFPSFFSGVVHLCSSISIILLLLCNRAQQRVLSALLPANKFAQSKRPSAEAATRAFLEKIRHIYRCRGDKEICFYQTCITFLAVWG